MSIQRLEISGIRSFRSAILEDCGHINVLVGLNGSGKTSILEAIHLLGLGRTFRSGRLTSIINHEMNACAVYSELKKNEARYQSLGIRHTRQGLRDLRINKAPIERVAELAKALPLQLINTDTFALIGGGPRLRRQFMDWGVFHVKPIFLEYWRTAQNCLRQRNCLLKEQRARRHGRIYSREIAIWDRELALCSANIDELRSQYIEDIKPVFDRILQRLIDLPNLSIRYQRGWQNDVELQAAFEKSFDRDVNLGLTTLGPHRANIEIFIEGSAAIDVLSRGQLKLVVSSLKLAQGQLLTKQRGDAECIYLVDDLPAELDKRHQIALCGLLDEMGGQVFITATDSSVIEDCWQNKGAIRRFHVKHGLIENKRFSN